MTTLTIELPDKLARMAKQAGLLEQDKLVQLIESQLSRHQTSITHLPKNTLGDDEAIAVAQGIFHPFTDGTTTVTLADIERLRDLEGI